MTPLPHDYAGSFCKYCERNIRRKYYPSGQCESDQRLLSREYCDMFCRSRGKEYHNTKLKMKVLEADRYKFIGSK